MKTHIFGILLIALYTAQTPAKITTPKLLTKTTIIELTDDIVIDSKTSPVIAAPEFGSASPEKVIFTSKTAKSVIVSKTGIWDLTSFTNKKKIIEFKGNAQLICEPGAKIIFNNGKLRFSDASKWLIS